MIVMKFGGTSVEDERAIERVSRIVLARLEERPVVVVSAMAGVTDSLLAMARAAASGRIQEALKLLRGVRRRHLGILDSLANGSAEPVRQELLALLESLEEMLRGVSALAELTPRTTDHILCTGELLSSRIVSAAFAVRGMNPALADARECIVTDGNHTNAVPLFDWTNERVRRRLQPLLLAGRVPVLGGFIAATIDGVPATLGRGGSDFSAAILGAALNARRIEIWTDVEGMMTTDPRLCPEAQRIDVIGFEEASELAYFGAKVLHPATLIPAVERNIPVYVLNSRNPASRGTCIRARAPRSRTTFRAIAAKSGIKVVNVKSPRKPGASGFLRAVFETFERHGCAADLVSTSEVSVSIALHSSGALETLLNDLKSLGSVDVEDGKAIICLVGKDIHGRAGIAASVFDTIAAANINVHMISQGASEINIGFVIEERDVPAAVRELHKRFFEVRRPARLAEVEPISRRARIPSCVGQASPQVEVG
ncbi:MAG TPA: lysine-sensitive aspartokinase 3 [Candidatus Binatia bacterium]|nr:lysine-sensitive aspartokinase 3 [Candidatus Binatia bacterium]